MYPNLNFSIFKKCWKFIAQKLLETKIWHFTWFGSKCSKSKIVELSTNFDILFIVSTEMELVLRQLNVQIKEVQLVVIVLLGKSTWIHIGIYPHLSCKWIIKIYYSASFRGCTSKRRCTLMHILIQEPTAIF